MSEKITIRSYLSPNYEGFYRYLGERLSQQLSIGVDFQVGGDFREFLTTPTDLVFACGFWYVQNASVYEPLVAPVMAGIRYQREPVYFVDVVTRAGRLLDVADLTGLIGKTFGFNEIQSFSGYHALVSSLARQGRTEGFFGRLVKTGSHLSSLEKILDGTIDYATLDSTVLDYELAKRPDLAAQLRIVTSLGPYPVPPLLINRALALALRARLLPVLLDLPKARLAEFGLLGYRAVDAAFYAPLARIYDVQPALLAH